MSTGTENPGTASSATRQVFDIENNSFVDATEQRFKSRARFQSLGEDGALLVTPRNTVPLARPDDTFQEEYGACLKDLISRDDLTINNEVTGIGKLWRNFLRNVLVDTYDVVNALRLTRGLQASLPFLTGYESYILGQLIEALEIGRKRDMQYALRVALSNRNVTRILVQVVGGRQDWVWHWSTQITWSRPFDMWGQLPLVGITSFPATENFPSTRNHVLASTFRVALGPGRWFTRVVTGGHQSFETNNPENKAQNLAPENGYEEANRSQYGPHVGRRKTNEFRYNHRLPTDESIVRTFVAQPMSTMLNNGVVHVLRVLAKHWRNILDQPGGNFAHQRMEQLNPFEALRFRMPVVLLTLSSLRGRNRWDMTDLGPLVRELEELEPESSAGTAKYLIDKIRRYTVIVNICGGIKDVADPLSRWLDAMYDACSMVEAEAEQVRKVVESVAVGVDVGHNLITQVDGKIPSDRDLKNAILGHICGSGTANVPENCIRAAMDLMSPINKRTLIELVSNGLGSNEKAQLLLNRVKTLLQREMRRGMLNDKIRELSKGTIVEEYEQDNWYWLEFHNDSKNTEAYIYHEKVLGVERLKAHEAHLFVNADTGRETLVSFNGKVKCYTYVPIAEAISRAQRAYMKIELDHGKKFAYDAFMEFTHLRQSLRRLIVVSQVTCQELDKARLNYLAEVQRSNQMQVSIQDLEPGESYYRYDPTAKEYKSFSCRKKYTVTDPEWETMAHTRFVRVPPQSMIVLGGGPTGLMTTIHCAESVLTSGGVVKLYEKRDAFAKAGAAFERAQIVRLDARWVAMLRYHLGTGFEDVFIPALGETDSQLGNTLPTQGFVEVTIKNLEYMLHTEVSKMWSKGLLTVHTDSEAIYDPESNSLTKLGKHLNMDDIMFRHVNEEGLTTDDLHPWKVVDLQYADQLGVDELRCGDEYGIYVRPEVLRYKLQTIDPRTQTYSFVALEPGKPDIQAHAAAMPYIYPCGTRQHAQVSTLIVESVKKGSGGEYIREHLSMDDIEEEKYDLDISHAHVVDCTGTVSDKSKVHFKVTTEEPYGVCCIEGLKVSMVMHSFGGKRWGSGIADDILSPTQPNTRIFGDFTKMIRVLPVVKTMLENVMGEENLDWQSHFDQVTIKAGFPELNQTDPIFPKIQDACAALERDAIGFRRQTLQTRFFETGDNYYLGMELPREYDKWKIDLVKKLVAPLTQETEDGEAQKKVDKFSDVLNHHIDRLWYDGVLEVIRTGDVYNAGARHHIPRLYLINSCTEVKLGSLPVGECFRLSSSREEKYEVVIKQTTQVVVRKVDGTISRMHKSTMVKREGNLSRDPGGNAESKVPLDSFNVKHVVNFRTAILNVPDKGYLVAFLGDRQAKPHFMRYSGLTGACINAMLFDNFIRQAIDGVPFIDRFRRYIMATNWSNGEVVQRGTGANNGEDGFLRPGFSYDHGMDYLYSKAIECREANQDMDNVLSCDWKNKFAAAWIPRGMELNEDFIRSLRKQLHMAVLKAVVKEASADESIQCDELDSALKACVDEAMADQREVSNCEAYWDTFVRGINVGENTMKVLEDKYVFIARRLDRVGKEIIEFSEKAHLYNERISSELSNQPKPVDSIVDDFAVEAQNFANALVMSAAFASGALAFTLLGEGVAGVAGAVLAGLNIVISFGTMTEVSRYKIRNEEARRIFNEEKMLDVLRGVFSMMDSEQQASTQIEENPFITALELQVAAFEDGSKYYGIDPQVFLDAYEEVRLRSNINDPKTIRAFQKRLATEFIPDVYSVNSYVQEYLVEIYKTLEDIQTAQVVDDRCANATEAFELFKSLSEFRGDLEGSLQLGRVRCGFIRERPFTQWQFTEVLKFPYSLMCCATRWGAPPAAPISTQILSLVKRARRLSSFQTSAILGRDIRDLESLYWATRESERASVIFTGAFLVFLASIVFTIGRIIAATSNVRVLLDFGFWASAPSTIGAMIATSHFWRKFLILSKLFVAIGSKIRDANKRSSLLRVLGITYTQILLTLLRLAASAAATVALPWSIAENQFPNQVGRGDLRFWVALGAVGSAILATLFFFMVEFWIRYGLTPTLGEFICGLFRDEIEKMYDSLSLPSNDIDTKQVQERERWEYVAREFLHQYRFDTVFAADRFGSILQYIQGGMVSCEVPTTRATPV